MDYPFGHPNHHHHHRRRPDEDEDEDYPPPYPPPSAYPPPPSAYADPTPPHRYGAYETPPQFESPNYPPPAFAHHASHVSYAPPVVESRPAAVVVEEHHHYRPHLPDSISGFVHGHTHQNLSPGFANKPSVRVYTKAEPNYSLTIRNGQVILARSDPNDPSQHWIKDEKYSTRVKDEEGFPSFALVNKATGQAMKHSVGATHPVQLIPYNPDALDESILWTESRDLGDSFRCIRMVNNIRLNVDAFNGDQNHGGVRDGTTIVLWEWLKGDNQRWKIVPY